MSSSNATEPREKLQHKLRELFQFESSDLDFGIYRILNHRHDEIEQFIEKGLLDAVEEALGEMIQYRAEDIEERLEAAKADVYENLSEDVIDEYGEVADETFRGLNAVETYVEIYEKKKALEVAEVTEARIYSDLLKFFSRYYDKGDFCTQRRYSSRGHKYMVPYDGEEVMLHWANKDQYYVKTGERFTNYDFGAADQSISFELVAADTPGDNNKSKGRYFIVPGDDCIDYDAENNQLTIEFVYRQLTGEKQGEYVDQFNDIAGDNRKTVDRRVLNTVTEQQILDALDAPAIKARLLEDHPDSTAGRTRLGHHLNRYTAANTHDYFVHKDLGGFLNEQLDFFIKNEVLNVDNFLTGDGSDEAYERALLRARAVRQIGQNIIEFLAQIEDFQKRLFEKKKFVVETNWCVTLDRVPDELYPTILDNREQLERWFELYAIDQWDHGPDSPEEIDEEFLEQYPSMMVDTACFGSGFTDELIGSVTNLETTTDGVLVKSENFQALNLLLEKYKNKVNCTYIDPPYNTGGRDFLYKDNYQHSSWLTMMADRIQLADSLLRDDGAFFSSVDEREQSNLKRLLNELFGNAQTGPTITWRRKKESANDSQGFSIKGEYLLSAFGSADATIYTLPLSDEYLDASYRDPTDEFPQETWRPVPIATSSGHQSGGYYYAVTSPTGKETKKEWLYPKERFEELRDKGRIYWGQNGDAVPNRVMYASESEGVPPDNIWYDLATNKQGKKKILDCFGAAVYDTPKPTQLINRILEITEGDNERPQLILDFFAGSGTTAHAVINRSIDSGDRKYILVEMGEYFDTVMLPRIQKVVFAEEWKDGVPQFDEDGDPNGANPHMFKYQRLESYEDALNNIELTRPDVDQKSLPDDYMLGYMLEVESRKSPSLLDIEAFDKPFDYKLEIQRGDVSPEPTTVDLQETFHYLIGMRVHQMEVLNHQGRDYRISRGEVRGPNGLETAMVVWRELEPELDYEAEKAWAKKTLALDEVDHVYVNGPGGITDYERIEYIFREKMDPAIGGGT